ncbi:MAG: hypothetical protein QOJ69_1597 [Actinomycetota bacterium]|jgi:hypothetical protein|nr:hypothetical protein [Actinomycetota bacterium]MEA2843926.1 hypothetical protein [Actinomycetota bacterium]
MLRKTLAATIVALALLLAPGVALADDAGVVVVLDQPGGGTQVDRASVLEGGGQSSLGPYLGICLGLCIFGLTLAVLTRRRLAAERQDAADTHATAGNGGPVGRPARGGPVPSLRMRPAPANGSSGRAGHDGPDQEGRGHQELVRPP